MAEISATNRDVEGWIFDQAIGVIIKLERLCHALCRGGHQLHQTLCPTIGDGLRIAAGRAHIDRDVLGSDRDIGVGGEVDVPSDGVVGGAGLLVGLDIVLKVSICC